MILTNVTVKIPDGTGDPARYTADWLHRMADAIAKVSNDDIRDNGAYGSAGPAQFSIGRYDDPAEDAAVQAWRAKNADQRTGDT